MRKTLMLLPLLIAQLAVAQDSTYSSRAVRDLVSRAVVANHAPPPALRGYRAHVESELSLLLRDSLGRERAAQIEQLASAIDWRRSGAYEMHVVGYRMQTLGSPLSTLSFLRGWTEPTLYGERLRIGVQVLPDSARPRADSDTSGRDSIQAVHPFASDREEFYQYSGGDTVTVLRAGVRAITVVRLRVKPFPGGDTPLSAFDGEIDLDAERGQIVRMRGRFVRVGERWSERPMLSRVPGLIAVAYVEFVNTEVNGLYWLPAYQRSEFQTTFALLGRVRAVMRIVSTFGGYETEERAGDALVAPADRDTHRTTWAPQDSVSRYGNWRASIGDMTASVTADDFDEFAPDAWKATGAPRVDFVPASTDNLVRFDRVQGLYTGMEANLQLRNMAPGVTIGALAGYAWTEQTVRGGVHASAQRGLWTYGARAERTLPSTNDFVRPFEPQSAGLAGVVGSIDDFDYVDRKLAVAMLTHVVGSVDRALLTVQLGAGEDRLERARLSDGWIGGGTFRPNRGALPGTYGIASVDAEYHPGLSGDFVQPGIGARLHLESARGELSWQRLEAVAAGRAYVGPVSLTAEVQGGVVTGRVIPPQQLFELGGSATLAGYDYKQFAGDRAALFRSFAGYLLPIWRAPRRVWGNLFIPGLSPGFAVGIEGGYTQISNAAAGVAVSSLGSSASGAPLSVASDRIRATTGIGATFFSGIIHLGVARPIDHPAPWKFVIGGGPSF